MNLYNLGDLFYNQSYYRRFYIDYHDTGSVIIFKRFLLESEPYVNYRNYFSSQIDQAFDVILCIRNRCDCLKTYDFTYIIPSYIKKVKGLSGCTQLGDGSIALILDPVGLIE